MALDIDQLTGRSETHLELDEDGTGLQPACWEALRRLQAAAAEAGFDLQIASGFRSFDRQLAIWNGKASGERAVYDDAGQPLQREAMSEQQWLHAILRFSALPGGSRHHWGTDLDVFDAAAMPEDYDLQLSPAETEPDGLFGPLHAWLDERIARGESFGFVRPYAVDRGGVACERWHLSYAPLAAECERQLDAPLLAEVVRAAPLQLGNVVEAELDDIYRRYILLEGLI